MDKTTFATGETGRKPKIVVWSSDGCKALAVLQGAYCISQFPGLFDHTILTLFFYKKRVPPQRGGGALLFAVRQVPRFGRAGTYCAFPKSDTHCLPILVPEGRITFAHTRLTLSFYNQDANHSVAIYDWKQEELLVTFTNDKGSKVCGIHWNPECGTIVTTGVKHVSFVENAWSPGKEIKKGTVMKPRRGVFGGLGKWQNFYTAAFTKADETVVGTQHGQLYVFSGNNLTRVIPKAHEGKVSAVFCLKVSISQSPHSAD